MHTPPGAPCCRKPAQPAHRMEQVRRRGWQHVPGETSPDSLAVHLAVNSAVRASPGGLEAWKTEAADPQASAPLRSVPVAPLQSPTGRKCACGGSSIDAGGEWMRSPKS